MEEKGEAGRECRMEVVGIPRDKVVPVEYVGVGVVPRPVDKLHRHNVVGDVKQHYR